MKQIYFFTICLFASLTINAQSNITFSVDMNGYAGGFTNVYVSGTLNGWCGDCNVLTDDGGGIWSVTLPLTDATYDYKFTIDNWTDQENFTAGVVCTTTNGGFTNRFLHVAGADIVLPTPAFGVCAEDPDDGPHNITLSVDMSGYTEMFTTAYVSGNFNGWNGVSNPLVEGPAGIWSATIAFAEAQHEFKFTVDDWADQENFTAGDSFTVTNGGFTNRFLQADTSKSLNYIWNQGELLNTVDVAVTNFKVYPNPTISNWNVSSDQNIISIAVYDVLGKQVLTLTPNTQNAVINASNLKSGLYFARINSENGSQTLKLVKE